MALLPGEADASSYSTTGGSSGSGGDFIGALIALGSAIYNSQAEKAAQKRQNKWNEAMSEKQFMQNVAMWKMQNEYNSPRAQMSRLEQAGLNPNMVYGANAPGNQSGSAPRMERPEAVKEFSPMDLTSVISQFQQIRMQQAQIDNVREHINNTRARTVNETLQATLKGLDIDQKSAQKPYFSDVAKASAEKARIAVNQELQRLANMQEDEQIKRLQQLSQSKDLQRKDVGLQRDKIGKQIDEYSLKRAGYENTLRKYNLRPEDPGMLRLFLWLINSQYPGKVGDKIRDLIP